MPFVDDLDLSPEQKQKSSRFIGHNEDTLNVFGLVDESKTIWRYMSFTQLLHLLESGQLHFTRADFFEDENEGMLPESEDLPDKFFELNGDDFFDRLKKAVFINCWHMNEHEHWGMWKHYSGKGIAIKSTIGRLRKALLRDEHRLGVHFSEVEYLDYNNQKIGFEVAHDAESIAKLSNEEQVEDFWNSEHVHYITLRPLEPFGYKQLYFGYENEFRAITMSPELDSMNTDYEDIYCDVYLHDLIEEIVLSPLAKDWEVDAIKAVLVKRYGLEEDVWVNESEIQ